MAFTYNKLEMATLDAYEIATMTSWTSGDLSNSTENATSKVFERDEDLAKVEIAVQAVILYLALFGNIFVLVVLRVRKQKMTRMQWFIVHLSLADIFVAIFNVLPQLIWDITYRFYGNDFLCRFVKYFQVVAMYGSSYVLVMTAIDRYTSICHPLTSHIWTPKRVHLMVLAAWVLSLLFSTPQLFIFSYTEVAEESGVYDCWAMFEPGWTDKLYTVWICLSIYVVPILFLSVCYGRIYHVVWLSATFKETDVTAPGKHKSILLKIPFRKTQRSTNHLGDEEDFRGPKLRGLNPRGHTKSTSKSKVKTIKMTLTVVLCYVLCWMPFFFAQMWFAFDPTPPITSAAMVIIILLASLNSCTNPWIYLAFSGRVCGRKQMRKMSRSWTQSTNVTHMVDTDIRSRSSTFDMGFRPSRDLTSSSRLSSTSPC
ncbi:annetocin receptor-like [Gigantopelta aegis]|uniref:annetocin receptor-like n=1 Tax=Gigantopelta aegis TaxID=1735272 RepID=UPI001B88869E|nr:annetocin receptor-like [Gigantopelta aegis]